MGLCIRMQGGGRCTACAAAAAAAAADDDDDAGDDADGDSGAAAAVAHCNHAATPIPSILGRRSTLRALPPPPQAATSYDDVMPGSAFSKSNGTEAVIGL